MDDRVKKFKKNVLKEITFAKTEKNIFDAVLLSLEQYYISCDNLKSEGVIIKSSKGITRKNPNVEVMKIAWANFLQGMKVLKILDLIQKATDTKRHVGRPSERAW